jgi:hypothetical protein
MFARLRGRLTFANAVSSIALFVALGGTSYAAVTLSSNSVRSKHIKNGQVKRADIAKNAVNADKVADGTLLAKDFKPGQFVAGAPGPAGSQGSKGETGPAGPFPDGNLPSGKTVRGNFFMTGNAVANNDQAVDSLSFVYTLPSAPTPHFIKVGDPPASGCPGTADGPQAAPGHLCVYERSTSGPVGARDVCGLDVNGSNCPGSNRWGAGVYELATGTGRFQSNGTWAVTAP